MKKTIAAAAIVASLSACQSNKIEATLPSGEKIAVTFYDGDNNVDDLLIVRSFNYDGKASYDMNDPLTDIAFRFNDGRKIQAECTHTKSSYGDKKRCAAYVVYRSSFKHLPEGTTFAAPDPY